MTSAQGMAEAGNAEISPRRPLLGVALAFAVGVYVSSVASISVWVYVVLAVIFALGTMFLLRRRQIAALVFALATVVSVGAAYFAFRVHSPPDLPASEPVLVKARGIVADLPQIEVLVDRGEREQRLVRFPLAVESLAEGDSWRPFSGKIQVSGITQKGDDGRDGTLTALRYGDRIELLCKLAPLPRPQNPGEFDYGRYLARRGIIAVATVPSGTANVLEGRGGLFFLRWLYDAKQRMRAYVDANLPTLQAALLKSLILGDRRAQPREAEAAYVQTGTVHFLVVSGLNVVLLALPFWFVLTLARVGIRATSLTVMAVALTYAVLGGLSPPVLRAAVMVAVFCGGYLFRRRPNFLNTMSVAAIIVMLADPADLLSAGFQLSFAAVLGLGAFAPRIRSLLFGHRDLLDELQAPEERNPIIHFVRRKLQDGLSVSLAASLTTIGFVLFYFHMIAPLGFLLTLILSPIVCAIVVLGFPAVLLGPLLGGVAYPILALAGSLAFVFDWFTKLSSHLPGTHFYLPGWGVAGLVAFYAFLIFVAAAPRLRVRAAHVCAVGLIIGCVFAGSDLWPRRHSFDITTLSVGQGTATFIQLPDGANILYDCGGKGNGTVGSGIVAPYLWGRGVTRLDVVIISHADLDHWNGLDGVLERFNVGRVVLPRMGDNTPTGAALIELLKRRKTQIVYVSAGDFISVGADTRIEVLHPPDVSGLRKLSPNDTSCVVRIKRPEASLLLAGDVQEQGITLLTSGTDSLHADVLLASHHGHSIANASRLLSAVSPRIVLMSGGADVAPEYDAGQWRALITGRRGAVTLSFETTTGGTRVMAREGADQRVFLTETWPPDK